MKGARSNVEQSFARFVSVVRWLLFLAFVSMFFVGIRVRGHCATELDAKAGHFYVSDSGARREVTAAEFDVFRKLKTLAWTLHWGSVVVGTMWGISLAGIDGRRR